MAMHEEARRLDFQLLTDIFANLEQAGAALTALARHCATRSCHYCCRSVLATIFSAIVDEGVWLAESSNNR